MQNNNFEYFFDQTLSESVSASIFENKKQDLEYIEINGEYLKLFNEIQTQLKDRSKMMLHFEELCNQLRALEITWAYKQGFEDCVVLLKNIKII